MRTALFTLLALSIAVAAPLRYDGLGPDGWAELLATDDEDVREEVVSRLRRGGRAGVEVLIPLLRHEDVRVRVGAATALWRGLGESEKAIPGLTRAGGASDCSVRERAASALGPMEARSKPAAPVLAKLLRDEEGAVSHAAAWALMRIGAAAGEAIQALVEFLAKDDLPSSPRWFALSAIARLGTVAIGERRHRARWPRTIVRRHE